jgi:MFS family permease
MPDGNLPAAGEFRQERRRRLYISPVPDARLAPFAALRHRNFRLFYIGQTTSLVGTWMQTLAQGWLVLQLTDSAFWVGLVSALGSLPVLLFSLPAGVYTDRADKHKLVLRCQALLLLQALVLTVLVATQLVRPWHVAVLAVIVGAINSFEIPARQSFIVELVGKDDLTNAIALNSSAFNATRIIGPTIAGLLVARVGIAACFAVNALTYLAPQIALRRIRMPPRVTPLPPAAPGAQRILEGLRFTWHEPAVRALIVNTGVLSLFGFPFLVLLPVFARDVLDAGAEGLGVMTALVGVGALIAALGLAAVGPRFRRGAMVAWASPMFGLAVAGFAYATWYPLALLVLALAGFTMVLNNAASNTLLQTLTPDGLRGRVMSIWSLVFVGFAPLGSLVIGALSGRIGPSAALALGGAVSAAFSVWMWSRAAPAVPRMP